MFYTKITINGTEYPLAVNITGAGAPTSSTAAEVGMFYMDTATGEVYKCAAVSDGTYIWELALINVVQSTGNSEKAVMSQKATTEEFDKLKTDVIAEIGEVLPGIINTSGVVYASGEGRHIVVAVNGGEKYIITGTNINYMYPCAFVKGGADFPTYELLIGGNNAGVDYANVEVTIPEGATTLYVNGYDGENKPLVSVSSLTKGYQKTNCAHLHISISDGVMFATSKYGKNDITVKFGKRGGNSLPDFITFYTSAHPYNYPVFNNADLVIFNSPDTDWHAPFVVQAVNNADGDLPEGYAGQFTGGNHGYNNTGTGSTPTARCQTLKYFVNGKEVDKYNDYAENIRIFWRNYIQGNNTKKADGTGREILVEEHTMTFDGIEWKTEVELIPLEDVIIKSWYGFQFGGLKSGAFSKIRYINATNRGEYDVTDSSISGNSTANGMIAKGENHSMCCEIDATYDLGKRDFYTGSQGVFALNYGKAYFFIINGGETFSANAHYYLRGSYKFSPAD